MNYFHGVPNKCVFRYMYSEIHAGTNWCHSALSLGLGSFSNPEFSFNYKDSPIFKIKSYKWTI